jgi:magnesium chelatase family protein
VGLPDAEVQESHERVQSAIKNAGLPFPRKRVLVNMAPADVRKEGPAYDLPIALGVLVMTGFVPLEAVGDTMVIGELSLDGGVRHVRGVLPMAAIARENGLKRFFAPEVDAPEAAQIPGIRITFSIYHHRILETTGLVYPQLTPAPPYQQTSFIYRFR